MSEDINEIRRAYCAHFVATGEIDQALCAKLKAYADAVRGGAKPRQLRRKRRLTPRDPSTGRLTLCDPSAPRFIRPSDPRFIGPKRPRGRPKGWRKNRAETPAIDHSADETALC